jgi:uncharacterized protein (TIGR02266 family)
MAKRKKILITEDVNVFLELEESLFQREGIDIIVAANGTQALEMIEEERPDLVLLDLDMDDLGGDECCLKIKENPDLKATPVLIMTHANWEEDIARAQSAKCDEIIRKPVNRQHLLKTVRELLLIADRTEDRIGATLPLHFGRLTDDQKSGFTVDVSVGGVFVRDSDVIPPGTPVTVTLPLPGEEDEVKCRGTVAWVNQPKNSAKENYPPGIGIQFVDINPDYRDAIRRYVEKMLESKSE